MPAWSRNVILPLILVVLPTWTSSQEKKAEPYEDKDAYEVYVAALALNRPHQGSIRDSKVLVISEEVRAWDRATVEYSGIKLSRKARKQWQTVLQDYIRANQTERRLVRGFPLDVPYQLVTEEDLDALRGGNFWAAFHTRFPESGGYIWFSSVGFNPERTRAIVTVSHSCGGLCGGGGPHFLEKKNGKWVAVSVDATFSVWAS